MGGRSSARRAAIVALFLVLAACSGDAGDAATTRDRSAATSPGAAVAGDARSGGGGQGSTATRATEAAARAATTTTTTPSTTTSRAPTTTARPTTTTTTAPPPPPTTTTAPPPPAPTATTAAPPPAGPRYGTRNTGCEQYMFRHINEARADAGQPALTFDVGIQSIPVDWSDELAGSQTLRHNPNYGDQIFAARPQAGTAAENVGRGDRNESLFNAFMASPGHRHNIESPSFSHVTIGCVNDPSGQIWVTQNFWG